MLQSDNLAARSAISGLTGLRTPETDSDYPWLWPPADLALADDEVHIWRASLELETPRIQALWHKLSADEKARTEHFYFENDRKHFIAARGLLRTILGRYLKTDPTGLQFSYNPYGKPSLCEENSGKSLSFNVSHSDGLALFAITRGRAIGVDIERLRAEPDVEDIAERLFARREVAMLRSLPSEQKEEAFLRYWTRKEAYIKARGEGLSMPLNQFDVFFTPNGRATILHSASAGETAAWSLEELHPGCGYVAALAVRGQDLRLKLLKSIGAN